MEGIRGVVRVWGSASRWRILSVRRGLVVIVVFAVSSRLRRSRSRWVRVVERLRCVRSRLILGRSRRRRTRIRGARVAVGAEASVAAALFVGGVSA